MNRSARRLAALFFLLLPFSAAAKRPEVIPPMSPVVAKLVIPERKTLPGVPFEMWIEVHNPSSTTVGVGLCLDMIVRPEGREAFAIEPGGEERPLHPTVLTDARRFPLRYLKLQPREKETLTLPLEPDFEGPVYFYDERLSKPGSYTISFRLDYCWPGMVVPQKSLLPAEYLGAVTTNEVIVERIVPAGVDAAVWQRMEELTGGHWVSASWTTNYGPEQKPKPRTLAGIIVIDEILTKYRESNYYPYAVLASTFGLTDAARHKLAVEALNRFPSTPVREWLEVQAWRNAGLSPARTIYYEKAKAAKRPTTRRRTFGREDLPPPPCAPTDDCTD